MSDDIAQLILCLSFAIPAVGILLIALLKRNIGGTDLDNSGPILEADEAVSEPETRPRLLRRLYAVSIAVCLLMVAAVTVFTLLAAGGGTAAASGKCPLGF